MREVLRSNLCALCGSAETLSLFEDKNRSYFRCRVCSLVFVPKSFHVSEESEKARYEKHNNDIGDAGYRQFLERIIVPIQNRFPNSACGIDYGCGPAPVLAELLRQKGFEVDAFDPLFADEPEIFSNRYDFVTATEVVEHMSRPLAGFKALFSLVKHDGMLAVMTRPYEDSIDFGTWHYKNDPTHVCFFSVQAFDWISETLGEPYERVYEDIFVFDRCFPG